MTERSHEVWSDDELDFTIARGVDESIITALRDYFDHRDDSSVEVDRATLGSALSEDVQLSKDDAEAVFTGLLLTGVAEQSSHGRSFADYTFTVDCDAAVRVLEGQRIARAALSDAGFFSHQTDANGAELTATFPPGLSEKVTGDVRPLSGDLRRVMFDAESVVRIANPYFDPDTSAVGDIASLANRGVTTKILTRETRSADEKLRSALNTIHSRVDPSNRHHLMVHDLYERNEKTGRQTYATHAKIAIADRDVCYVGSANLTETSLSLNFELGVLLRGENVDIAIDIFDAVFDFASEVSLPL